MSVPEDKVTYDFTASDGTVITLRRMSDRQRTRFFNFDTIEITRAFQPFIAMVAGDAEITREIAQVPYDGYRKLMMKFLSDLLVNPKDMEILETWDHPGDYPDFIMLGNLIAETEAPKEEDTQIPTPDEVDKKDDKEIERLGESSARKSRRASTSPSSTAGETSSSGAESTPDVKPET